MSNQTVMVPCAYCGKYSPYDVTESYGWLKLFCSKYSCYKPFEAVIKEGVLQETRKIGEEAG
jgi:hypothetical protein